MMSGADMPRRGDMFVHIDMAVVPHRAGGLGDELVGEGVARLDAELGDCPGPRPSPSCRAGAAHANGSCGSVVRLLMTASHLVAFPDGGPGTCPPNAKVWNVCFSTRVILVLSMFISKR